YPKEVIDVATPTPPDTEEEDKDDVHMEELLAGRGKRLRSPQSESKEAGTTGESGTRERASMATSAAESNQGEGYNGLDPGDGEDEEEKAEEKEGPDQTSDQPTHDSEQAEKLSFAEMYNYLYGEAAGKTIEQAQEIVSVEAYVTSMFGQVFSTHPKEALAAEKRRYPELTGVESEHLLRLFLLDANIGRADSRKWKQRLYDITRAIYKSRRSLCEIIEHRISTSQVRCTQPALNPWAQRTSQENMAADGDVDMSADKSSKFRFLKSAYTAEEISALRSLCETPYGFPAAIRKPTTNEAKVIKGLLEGTILCAELPSFLKRVCTNEALRRIQNTIQAQVEGDLAMNLPQDFPVYPDFQSRDRLISMILLKPENGGHDKAKLVELLHDTKQICYDRISHAIHLIFWTREQATTWSKAFKTLPFRNRVFRLQNEHPEVLPGTIDNNNRSTSVWGRQVGADGVRNEMKRDRYHVRLLNISRFIDEAAVDTYIQQQFDGTYTTWQEPTTGNRARQTDTWEIFFKTAVCPAFLAGSRFLNWNGVKILIHHVSAKPSPPCFQCGASGHTRTKCNAEDDYWKTCGYCITVSADAIAALPRQTSTVTSFEELTRYWIDEEQAVEPNSTVTPKQRVRAQDQTLEPGERVATNQGLSHPTQTEWYTVRNKRATTDQGANSEQEAKQTGLKEGPRSILSRKTSPSDTVKPLDEEKTRSQSTAVEPEAAPAEHQSIGVEVGRQLSVRSPAMEKQQSLIEKQVQAKRKPSSDDAMMSLKNLNLKKFTAKAKSVQEVAQASGLEVVDTPPNGNCQYYAVAMALLNRTFELGEDQTAVETLTAKLKKGILAASNHFFEEEYPHSSRMYLLRSINNHKQMKLTEDQSKTELRRYFSEIVL
ncbi:hypothetical protein PR002_g22958, partial [Phytophthora rubi]